MPERSRVATAENAPEKVTAKFEGFSPYQKERVSEHIQSIGLPADNIETVAYRPNQKGQEAVLGSYQPHDGTLTLYKSLDKLPPIAQHGTIVHELAHSSSPLDPNNERFYGSEESIDTARNHAVAVAKQSELTGKFLNGYQAYLYRELKAKRVDQARFIEETYAIMMELRFTNPHHLQPVETAQKKQLAKMRERQDPEALSFEPVNISQGVDRTISALIPGLETKSDIDEHADNLRKNILAQGKLLPSKAYLHLL